MTDSRPVGGRGAGAGRNRTGGRRNGSGAGGSGGIPDEGGGGGPDGAGAPGRGGSRGRAGHKPVPASVAPPVPGPELAPSEAGPAGDGPGGDEPRRPPGRAGGRGGARTSGPVPWLVRSRVRLRSGSEVGVAVAGHGVPLVVVHGYGAEGVLYAQTLTRLVDLGFLVVAVDSPGHGITDPVGALASLDAYVELIRQTLDELGIRRAVLAGHSMGGRLVAELAAGQEELPIGVVLVDAIAGDRWDRMNRMFRLAPPTLLGLGAAMVADTVTTLPVLSDPAQTARLARLMFPLGVGHVRRPWRLVGPLASILRAPSSGDALDELRRRDLPVVVVHGERDLPVPADTGRAAAARVGGEFVLVRGARHSWMLRDPETFPAIMAELLEGRLGEAVRQARDDAGLDDDAPAVEVSEAFCAPDAAVLDLAAAAPTAAPTGRRRAGAPTRRPRYRWTSSFPAAPAEEGS